MSVAAALNSAADTITSVATDVERKSTAVAAKVKKLLSGDDSKPAMGADDGIPMLKKALAAIQQLCVDQAGIIKHTIVTVKEEAAGAMTPRGDHAGGAGAAASGDSPLNTPRDTPAGTIDGPADLNAALERLAQVAQDLERKSTAVNAKVKKLSGDGADAKPASEQFELMKKALAALHQLCVEQAGLLKSTVAPIKAATNATPVGGASTEPATPSVVTPAIMTPREDPSVAEVDESTHMVVAEPEPEAAPTPAPARPATVPPVNTAAAIPKPAAPKPAPSSTSGGTDNGDLEAQLKVTVAERNLLRTDFEQLQEAYETRESELSQAQEKLTASLLQVKELQDHAAKAFAEEKAALDNAMSQLREQIATQEQNLTTAAEEKQSAITELAATHDAAAADLRREIEAIKQRAAAEKAAVEHERDEVRASLATQLEKEKGDNLSLRAALDEAYAAERAAKEVAELETARARAATEAEQRTLVEKAKADNARKAAEHLAESLKAALRQSQEHASTARLSAEKESKAKLYRIKDLELEISSLQARLLDDHLRELVRKQQADIAELREARIADQRKLAEAISGRASAAAEAASRAGSLGRSSSAVGPLSPEANEVISKLRAQIVNMEAQHLCEIRDFEVRLHKAAMQSLTVGNSNKYSDPMSDPPTHRLSGSGPLLVNNSCQADDGALRRSLRHEAELTQQLDSLTEELDIIRSELSTRVADLETHLVGTITDHDATVDALNSQIRLQQFKNAKLHQQLRTVGLTGVASGSPNRQPRSVSAEAADDAEAGTSAPAAVSADAMHRESVLRQAASELDRWRAAVERDNAGMRLELEVHKAKIKSLRHELDRQRDEYETRIQRMAALHEGQTRAVFEQSSLERDVAYRGRSSSSSALVHPANTAAGANSNNELSAAGGSSSPLRRDPSLLSPDTSRRLSRLQAIDDDLHALHQCILTFDHDAISKREQIEAALDKLAEDEAKVRVALAYWEGNGDADAAAEERSRLVMLQQRGDQGEKALAELLTLIQIERKKLVENTNKLLTERSDLTSTALVSSVAMR
jgi:hypothetical protein